MDVHSDTSSPPSPQGGAGAARAGGGLEQGGTDGPGKPYGKVLAGLYSMPSDTSDVLPLPSQASQVTLTPFVPVGKRLESTPEEEEEVDFDPVWLAVCFLCTAAHTVPHMLPSPPPLSPSPSPLPSTVCSTPDEEDAAAKKVSHST